MRSTIRDFPPRLNAPSILAGLAILACAAAAGAQLASWHPPIPPESTMSIDREGEFEVWREGRLLGTETYRTWRSATGDTLFAFSSIGYDMDGRPDSSEYGMQTMHITRSLDQMPLFFQTIEASEGTSYRASVSFQDTVVQVYQEEDQGGQGWTIAVPEGKLFVLEPGVYQLVEFLAGDFSRRGIARRTHRVFLPRTRQVIEVQLVRGAEEVIEWPKGRKTRARATDLTIGSTAFEGWFDGEGRLLLLEAPAERSRVVRRPGPTSSSR